MADTLEKRLSDLEQILSHLPDDLDARLAGADARAGARFDRLNIQLQALKAQVQQGQTTTATQIAAIDSRLTRIEAQVAAMDAKLDDVLSRLPPKA
jgi:ABC-type transporter Mla subunit MlaD